MFREIILPIFRSTRLCVTVCGIMEPRCCRPLAGRWPATSWVHYTTNCNTQSSAPEDGRNHRPKHVELTGIINKLLLLHLLGCIYYLFCRCTVRDIINLFVSCTEHNKITCRRALHYYACDKFLPASYEYYTLPIKFVVSDRIITKFCKRNFD